MSQPMLTEIMGIKLNNGRQNHEGKMVEEDRGKEARGKEASLEGWRQIQITARQ